jgi:hypothetical protein
MILRNPNRGPGFAGTSVNWRWKEINKDPRHQAGGSPGDVRPCLATITRLPGSCRHPNSSCFGWVGGKHCIINCIVLNNGTIIPRLAVPPFTRL